ncbi:DsrE family protein [Chlorobium sp. N1]|uniref:DsrE family protein n=1 Tax=Chlorobium sp. N1 TaxID=2491138 RepID=UPI00103D09E6|nr:DsrE family protein [Chlorobium sp. N1]TCD48338.1 hypothetical protein E0L29_00110 [Chlorobium sp. N1]
MKAFLKLFSLAALFAVLSMPSSIMAANGPKAAQSAAADGMFVVMTDADSMTQMMALVLSTQTVQQGRKVQILLCGPAGSLALKNGGQKVFKPIGKSPAMLLKGLIAKGVKVELCPLYLPNTGHKASEMIEGVTIAKPPVVAASMAAEGMKLFTF